MYFFTTINRLIWSTVDFTILELIDTVGDAPSNITTFDASTANIVAIGRYRIIIITFSNLMRDAEYVGSVGKDGVRSEKVSCLLSEEGGKQPNGGLLWDRKFFGQIRLDWKTVEVSSLSGHGVVKTRSNEQCSRRSRQSNNLTSFFIKNEVQLLSSRERSIKYQ